MNQIRAAGWPILLTIAATMLILPHFFSSYAMTTPTANYLIVQDPVLNECDEIGSWDAQSSTCTLAGDVKGHLQLGFMNGGGITVDGNGYTLSGDGSGIGVSLPKGSHDNVITNATIVGFDKGISGIQSYGNELSGNTIDANHIGLYWYSSTCPSPSSCGLSTDNRVFNNNFLNNQTQVYDVSFISPPASGEPSEPWFPDLNSYYQPLPVGGNYWQGWDHPDDNRDGIVDQPYTITEKQQDQFPWAWKNAWRCDRALLEIGGYKAYWARFADYIQGVLSIDLTISNRGNMDAIELEIVAAPASHDVVCVSPMPVPMGDISVGEAGTAHMEFMVPAGVSYFSSSISATDRDSCGNAGMARIY